MRPQSRQFLIYADGTVTGGSGERAPEIADRSITTDNVTEQGRAIGACAILARDGTETVVIAHPPVEVDFSIYD